MLFHLRSTPYIRASGWGTKYLDSAPRPRPERSPRERLLQDPNRPNLVYVVPPVDHTFALTNCSVNLEGLGRRRPFGPSCQHGLACLGAHLG